MAYRTRIAQGYAAREGAAACDQAVRNAGLTMIAVANVATGVGVGGVGLEAAYAVTASPARCDVQGVNAPTAKTTNGMKAAAMKTASGSKAAATMETATAATVKTAAAAMKTTAAATMETAATATLRLGYAGEREPQDCARQDPSERQRDLFAAPSSQHIFLHPN